jgi:hypothetical protein
VTDLRATLELRGERERSNYGLTYEARASWVEEDSSDDHVNQRAAADAAFQFDLRNRFAIGVEYRDWYDRRGNYSVEDSGRQNFFDDEPDNWHEPKVDAVYQFGAPSAKGRIEIFGDYGWRRYDNNDQEFRHRNTGNIGGTFFFRAAPKTQALLEARYRRIDYVNEPPEAISLDSKETRLMGGAVWDATAKTTGALRLGWVKKKFDDSARKDSSYPTWEVSLNWKPRTYSQFGLTTSQMPYETLFADEDSVKVTTVALDWTHDWNSRLRSRLGGQYWRDEGNRNDTTDKTWAFKAGLTYSMRRWLDLGASYRYHDRDSEISTGTGSYNNNVFMLSADAAM